MKINDRDKFKHTNIYNKYKQFNFPIKRQTLWREILRTELYVIYKRLKMAQNRMTGDKPNICYQKESQKIQS